MAPEAGAHRERGWFAQGPARPAARDSSRPRPWPRREELAFYFCAPGTRVRGSWGLSEICHRILWAPSFPGALRAGKREVAPLFFCRIRDSLGPLILWGTRDYAEVAGARGRALCNLGNAHGRRFAPGDFRADPREQSSAGGDRTALRLGPGLAPQQKVSAWKPMGGAGPSGSGFTLCPGEGGCRLARRAPQRRDALSRSAVRQAPL